MPASQTIQHRLNTLLTRVKASSSTAVIKNSPDAANDITGELKWLI